MPKVLEASNKMIWRILEIIKARKSCFKIKFTTQRTRSRIKALRIWMIRMVICHMESHLLAIRLKKMNRSPRSRTWTAPSTKKMKLRKWSTKSGILWMMWSRKMFLIMSLLVRMSRLIGENIPCSIENVGMPKKPSKRWKSIQGKYLLLARAFRCSMKP